MVAFGRVYVPDYASRAVHVVDAGRDALRDSITEVAGPSETFLVELRNGRVWIHDQYGRNGKVVDPDGRVRTIDVGTGHGVTDEDNPPEPAVGT